MPSTNDPGGRERTLLFACAGATLVSELALLARMNLAEVVRQVPDDSFFYLVIAERLRDGLGFTFDGEHRTYGFQPLYQLLMAALAFLVREPVALLRTALALGSVLHVACVWPLFALVRRSFGRSGAWTASVFWLANPALVSWFWSVKENGLYALFLLWMFLELLRAITADEPLRRARRLGVIVGLLVLTRVNFAPLWLVPSALLALGLGWRRPARERVRFLLAVTGWACLVAGPWYAFARLHFGTAMPSSGVIKLVGAREYVARELGVAWLSPGHFARAARLAWGYLDETFKAGSGAYGPFVLGGLLAVLAGWALARSRGREIPAAFERSALALAACVAACAAANAFLNALSLPQFLAYAQWYTAPELVALAVLVGWTGAMARRTLVSYAGAVLLVLGAASGVVVWSEVRRVPRGWRGPQLDLLEQRPATRTILLEMGLWAHDHVPEGARVGIRDPGIVTFFSRRKLVALDPLVNSLAYFREESRDLPGYVRRNEISYVMAAGVRRDGRFRSLMLPEGSYEVVWVPYPEVDLGWRAEPTYWMVVRPLDTPGPAFLGPDDFPCGVYAPDSGEPDALAPARAQRVARALSGFPVECDVLRVRLAARDGARAALRLDGELARDTEPGPDGWIDWDVSGERGRSARLEVLPAATVEDVHFVDLRPRPSTPGGP